MPFDGVLFDFDGTLADSYGAIAASVNYVRVLRGHAPLTIDQVKQHVGRGPEHLLTQTVPDSDLAQDLADYRQHHPTIMAEMTTLLPGAREALVHLKRRGMKIALCSNKPRRFSSQLLDDLDLGNFFDTVVGPEDVPRPKPAPDMACLALERLGIAAHQALYIGDMVVDIETARAAGVAVWIVPTGSDSLAHLEARSPDRILMGLADLLAL